MPDENSRIVFYDGDCGFCNRTVAFVLKNDKSHSIRFTALQSDYTKELFALNKWSTPDLSTFYFFVDGKLYQKSTAALKLAKFLSFPHSLLQVFWIAPKFLRDFVYSMIAKRRGSFSKGFCVLPEPEQLKRFIK